MTQEQKQLLLKDLCTRLPYGVKCHYDCVVPIYRRELIKTNSMDTLKGIIPMPDGHIGFMIGIDKVEAIEGDIKPYLRPMSSMTEEERKEFSVFIGKTEMYVQQICLDADSMTNPIIGGFKCVYWGLFDKCIDWLNAHHFDYRGLIEKGLALEAHKDMYKTE